MAALREAIFPGGAQEKLFRAQKVHGLCNGKLSIEMALHVYTKAKVRYKIACWKFDGESHRGITADELIARTKEDSGGKLSPNESAAVNSYVIFDRVEGVVESRIALVKILEIGFGSNAQGYDCDVIPFGIGEYGLEFTNPVPIIGICGIQVYLSRLRRENGEKVVYKRSRAIPATPESEPVDEYDIFSEHGEFLVKLYICPYHQRISRKAPRGFKLAGTPDACKPPV